MDRYSGWPMAAPIQRKANTTTITDILDEWFVDHGIPVSIRTDGGLHFRGPFDEWCTRNNICHELSSAYHHESNGHAECAVREIKKTIGQNTNVQGIPTSIAKLSQLPQIRRAQPGPMVFRTASANRSHSFSLSIRVHTRPNSCQA